MKNLLLDEYPLIILPSLATKIGLSEAIVLQQIHYWLTKSANVVDDEPWVYNSISDWQKQFPFFSESTIKRILKKLEQQELIKSACFNKLKMDRTKWYTINYASLALGQFDPTIRSNWPNQQVSLTPPLPETTTETTSKTTSDRPPLPPSGEKDTDKNSPFDIFWLAYPNKTGKGKARQKYDKAMEKTSSEVVLKAVEYNKSNNPQWSRDNGQYIPMPATWLLQERWSDELIKVGTFTKKLHPNAQRGIERFCSEDEGEVIL